MNGDLPIQEGPRSFRIVAAQIAQPIGVFYVAAVPVKVIKDICFFDIRGIKPGGDLSEYSGIQRTLDMSRVGEIAQYVKTVDATFPTGIVIAIDERCARSSPVPINVNGLENGSNQLVCLEISNDPNPEDASLDPILYKSIARVIDGQHRIAGLLEAKADLFDVHVVIFIGADIATQAQIFATVNKAQTKVNKSLVFDLRSYEGMPSPEKTCHEIAVALDFTEGSPFYRRIKRLGVATDGRFGETLSQATFVKRLIPYISRDVVADRDAALRGKPYPLPPPKIRERLILRSFFTLSRETELAQMLLDYFSAVRDRWPKSWAHTGRGNILSKSTGYTALMRLFADIYLDATSPGEMLDYEVFAEYFQRSSLEEVVFRSDAVQAGTSGEVFIYKELHASIFN